MKTMQKESRGKDFGGLIRYIFDRDDAGKDAGRFICGSVTSDKKEVIVKELQSARSRRPDVEKAVWHNALRLPAGEKLTDEQWVKVADDFMKGMGFTDAHAWVAVQHDDPEGQHLHLCASRIGYNSNLWLGQNSNLQATKLAHALEIKHGLQVTGGPTSDHPHPSRKPSSGAIAKALRTDAAPPIMLIQQAIDRALAVPTTLEDMIVLLSCEGIECRVNRNATSINGLSFSLDNHRFTGSQLGASYKWASLKARLKNDDNAKNEGPRATTPPPRYWFGWTGWKGSYPLPTEELRRFTCKTRKF